MCIRRVLLLRDPGARRIIGAESSARKVELLELSQDGFELSGFEDARDVSQASRRQRWKVGAESKEREW